MFWGWQCKGCGYAKEPTILNSLGFPDWRGCRIIKSLDNSRGKRDTPLFSHPSTFWGELLTHSCQFQHLPSPLWLSLEARSPVLLPPAEGSKYLTEKQIFPALAPSLLLRRREDISTPAYTPQHSDTPDLLAQYLQYFTMEKCKKRRS